MMAFIDYLLVTVDGDSYYYDESYISNSVFSIKVSLLTGILLILGDSSF